MRRHNKKRNSALLYEFPIRHISKCLVEANKDEANKALAISKKYFAEGTALRRELDLFSAILKTNVRSKDSAQKILNAVCESASRMNVRLMDEQKSKLIREINYTLNPAVYDYKIPNYTIYASIQTVLNEARNKNKSLDIVSKVKIEESILEHLTRNAETQEDLLKVNPNYSNAVYKFLIQRFDKKYEGKINENQKKLLMKYAVYLISNNNQQLKEYLATEINRIKLGLKSVKDESIRKDSDIMKKIGECYSKFSTFGVDDLNDQKILEVLQYQRLVEEVES
jgi:hypothetical protein